MVTIVIQLRVGNGFDFVSDLLINYLNTTMCLCVCSKHGILGFVRCLGDPDIYARYISEMFCTA